MLVGLVGSICLQPGDEQLGLDRGTIAEARVGVELG